MAFSRYDNALVIVVVCEGNVKLGFSKALDDSFVPSVEAIIISTGDGLPGLRVQNVVIASGEYIINKSGQDGWDNPAVATKHFAAQGFVTMPPSKLTDLLGIIGVDW